MEVPSAVLRTLRRQLRISNIDQLPRYGSAEQRWEHTAEIRNRYAYYDWFDPAVGWRLSRWLYALCWTGTEQPSVLFDRATTWLLAHKVILPGCTTLERFVARLRNRVEERLWKLLGEGITDGQRTRLDDLLTVPPQSRGSWLDKLRKGPVRVSGRALVLAITRLQTVRDLGIKLPLTSVPPSRIASLARFAGTAKATAISRLPPLRRMATLVAFVHCLEATAQDDVLDLIDRILHEFFTDARKATQKARLRTIKDLDAAASALATACRPMLDTELADAELRKAVFARIPLEDLAQALARVDALVRPPDDVYFRELDTRYRTLRIFLPALLKHIRFDASPAGEAVVAGFDWLKETKRAANRRSCRQPPKAPSLRLGSVTLSRMTERLILAPTLFVCSTGFARRCAVGMFLSPQAGVTQIPVLAYLREQSGKPHARSFAEALVYRPIPGRP